MTPAEGSVNMNRFTLYAMIPGLDTYVATKLDKKKFASIYTAIFIVGILTFTAIVMYNISVDPELIPEMEKTERVDIVYEKFMPQMVITVLSSTAIHFSIYPYLIRKRAKEWNKKFKN